MIQFDGSGSTDTDCYIVSYSWHFGDGNVGQGVNPVHSYAVAGDYVVTLTVTDNDGLTGSATATVSVVDVAPADGAALYDQWCAACHGPGDSSSKAGATVDRINNGIASEPDMNFLAGVLSAADIAAIADFLATAAPPTTPEGLYTAYCASCHGADGSGGITNENVIGDSAGEISDAIAEEQEMQSLSFLTSQQIQLIADFLNGRTAPSPDPDPPVGGIVLYDNYCAACHGSDGSGGSSGENVQGDSAGDIREAIREERDMRFLDFLSYDEIQEIADYLETLKSSSEDDDRDDDDDDDDDRDDD
jgi:mono/diheme cytochrome c family protein